MLNSPSGVEGWALNVLSTGSPRHLPRTLTP